MIKKSSLYLPFFLAVKLAVNIVVFAANNWFFLWTTDDIYRLDRALLFAQRPASIFEHVWLPLPFIIQGTLSLVFHNPALVAAIVNTLLSLLIILFFYKIIQLLELGNAVFCITSIIFICTPYYTWISLTALGEGYYFAAIVFWIYFYLKFLKTNLIKYKYLGALFLFLATLVRYEAYMFVIIFLISEGYFFSRTWKREHALPNVSFLITHYLIPALISILGIFIMLSAYKIKYGSFFWSFEVVTYWQDTRYLATPSWKKFLLLGSWLVNLYIFPLIIFIPFALPYLKKHSPLSLVMLLLVAGEFLLMSMVQARSPVSCSHKHKVILITNLLLLPFIAQGFLRVIKRWKKLRVPLWGFFIIFFGVYLLLSLKFHFQRTKPFIEVRNATANLLKQTRPAVPDGKIVVELFPHLPYRKNRYMHDTLRLKYRFGDPLKIILDHKDYQSCAENNSPTEFRPLGEGLFDDISPGEFEIWAKQQSVVGIICTSKIHLKTITPYFKKILKVRPYTLYARADLIDAINITKIVPYIPGWADQIRETVHFQFLYQLFQPQHHPYFLEGWFIPPQTR